MQYTPDAIQALSEAKPVVNGTSLVTYLITPNSDL